MHGVVPAISVNPPGLGRADQGLFVIMGVDVLGSHLLRTLAAIAVQSLQQRGPAARQASRLVQVFISGFGDPPENHRASEAIHRGVAGRDQDGNDASPPIHRGGVFRLIPLHTRDNKRSVTSVTF